MDVVDAHTHIFPDETATHRSAWLKRDDWFGLLYDRPGAAIANAEDLILSMDEAGIARSIVCGFPWRDGGLCNEHNAYLAEAASSYPDRISWLATVSPVMGDQASISLERAFESGAAGAGELNADAQGFGFAKRSGLDDIADLCERWDRPLLLHVSEPIGHPYPGKGTATPDRVLHFLRRHPGLRMVAAHWGGGLPFFELMPEVQATAKNVVYDSAATTYLYDFHIFRSVIDVVGPDRVLFASDYPVLQQRRLLDRCNALLSLSSSERNALFSKNAIRVYGLAPNERQQT